MHNVFDQKEIVIVQISSHTHIEMEAYLTECGVLLNSEIKYNGDSIYYITCPNEASHSSAGENHTMIFHRPGEKEPRYHCHHTSCAHLTFHGFVRYHKISVEKHTPGGLPQESFDPEDNTLADDAVSVLKKEISFHGMDEDGSMVYSSGDSLNVFRISPDNHTWRRLYAMYGNDPLVEKAFPKTNAQLETTGINYERYIKWLIDQCKQVGTFKEDTIKPLGIHKKDQEYVLNTGDCIYSQGEKYDYFTARKRYNYFFIPAAKSNITIAKSTLDRCDFNIFIENCERLPFKTKKDLVVFLGVLACGLIPGGIDTRPSMWMTGKAGCGKTSILESVLSPIWRAAGALILEGGSTGPGIEQNLNGKNVSIVFDEAESDTSRGQMRILGVLENLKSSTTAGTGSIVKGTAGGTAKSYRNKSCYCLSSVGSMINDDTIKRRVFPVQIEQQDHHKQQWRTTYTTLKQLLTTEYTNRMFLSFFNSLDQFDKNSQEVERYLNDTSIPATVLAMWTSIITGYLMMITDQIITRALIQHHIGTMIDEVSKEHADSKAENDDTEGYLLSIIMSETVMDENNKRIPISYLIRISRGLATDIDISITAKKAQAELKTVGLKTNEDNELCIHSKHPKLSHIFNKNNVSDYASRLIHSKDARKSKSPLSFGSGKNRCIIIPIPEELLAPTYEPLPSYEGEIHNVFEDQEIIIK